LMPAVVTTFILAFINTWNEFLLPLYFLNSAKQWPMTLSVYNFFGQYQMDWNLVSADIVMTCLPAIILYLLGQRYIISGMTSGSVKG
ncbi:carbohydrate ABC transporter permease, partial [Paenibacillus sp. TAF58]